MPKKKQQAAKDSSKALEIKDLPLDSITPYLNNPRQITNEAIRKVADSLQSFGWRQPIVVDSDMVVVVGHVRLEAAKRLGYKTVPVHIASDLTPEQASTYRLMDNRSGEFAEWNDDLLLTEIEALSDFNADFIGFEMEDVDPLAHIDEWDFSEVHDEFVVTVRGPLDVQAEVRKRLEGMGDVQIEAGYIPKAK